MTKSLSIMSTTLLAASLMITAARGYADDDRRQDLRQDHEQLQDLRRQRQNEIREGDRHEAREYDKKIHNLQKDIRKDERSVRRDREDRDHHDRDHDHD
jgi:hypothetical protein